jgi:hypothetical protein
LSEVKYPIGDLSMDEMFKIIVENAWQIITSMIIYNHKRCGGRVGIADFG